MEYFSSSDSDTIKSRIVLRAIHVTIPMIIVIISILIPVVFFKSEVFLKPNSFEFLQRWVSRPYIYLVLNLVIMSILASQSLCRCVMCIFSYFKEDKDGYSDGIGTRIDDKPSEAASSEATTTTITPPSEGHFYQYWQGFIQDHTPTYLSTPLEIQSLDEPWQDTNVVASSIKAQNSSHEPVKIEERNFAKNEVVNQTFTPNKVKIVPDFDDGKSLENTWNAIKGRKELVPSPFLIQNNCNNLNDLDLEDTLEGTWKTIMQGGNSNTEENNITNVFEDDHTLFDTQNAPVSSVSFDDLERLNVHSSLISPRIPRQDALAAWRELRKSETFNETVSVRQRTVLRRDPSVGLDELNCRVESFIKNFNHQMLLQRQESEQRFLEMINSGG